MDSPDQPTYNLLLQYSRFIELSTVPSSDIAICISYILIQQRKIKEGSKLGF